MAQFEMGVDPELINVLKKLETVLNRTDKGFTELAKAMKASQLEQSNISKALEKVARSLQLMHAETSDVVMSIKEISANSKEFKKLISIVAELDKQTIKNLRSTTATIKDFAQSLLQIQTTDAVNKFSDIRVALLAISDLSRSANQINLTNFETNVNILVQGLNRLTDVSFKDNLRLTVNAISGFVRSFTLLNNIDFTRIREFLFGFDDVSAKNSIIDLLSQIIKSIESTSKNAEIPNLIISTINAISEYISAVVRIAKQIKDTGTILTSLNDLKIIVATVDDILKAISRSIAQINVPEDGNQSNFKTKLKTLQAFTAFIEQFIRLTNKVVVVNSETSNLNNVLNSLYNTLNSIVEYTKKFTNDQLLDTTNFSNFIKTFTRFIEQIQRLPSNEVVVKTAEQSEQFKIVMQGLYANTITPFLDFIKNLVNIDTHLVEKTFISTFRIVAQFFESLANLTKFTSLVDMDNLKLVLATGITTIQTFFKVLLKNKIFKRSEETALKIQAIFKIVQTWQQLITALSKASQITIDNRSAVIASVETIAVTIKAISKLMKSAVTARLITPESLENLKIIKQIWQFFKNYIESVTDQGNLRKLSFSYDAVDKITHFLNYLIVRLFQISRRLTVVTGVNVDTIKNFTQSVSAILNAFPTLDKAIENINKTKSGIFRRLIRLSGIDQIIRVTAYLIERLKGLARKYKRTDLEGFNAVLELAKAVGQMGQAVPAIVRASEQIPDGFLSRLFKFYRIRRFYYLLIEIIRELSNRLKNVKTDKMRESINQLIRVVDYLFKIGSRTDPDFNRLDRLLKIYERFAAVSTRGRGVPVIRFTTERIDRKDFSSTNNAIKEVTDVVRTAVEKTQAAVVKINPLNWSIVKNAPVVGAALQGIAKVINFLVVNGLQQLINFDQKLGTTLAVSVSETLNRAGEDFIRFGQTVYRSLNPIQILRSSGAKLAEEYDDLIKQFNVFAANLPIDEVERLANEIGIKYPLSANEALAATLDLAKAGLNLNQIFAILPSAADLASLSDSKDVTKATQTLIAAARGLRLFRRDMAAAFTPENIQYATSAIFAVANATTATVDSIQEGLVDAVPAANNFGQSLEQLVAALGAFNDAQVKGSEAGRLFASTLTGLFREQSQSVLASLGVRLADETGRIRELNDIIKDLAAALEPYNEAARLEYIRRIGDVFAQRGLGILLARQGLDDIIDAINTSIPASEAAIVLLESYKGQLQQLSGSFETFLISVFRPILNDFALPIIKFLRDIVDFLIILPQPIKNVIAELTIFVSLFGSAIAVMSIFGGIIAKAIGLIFGLTAAFFSLAPIIKISLVSFIYFIQKTRSETGAFVRTGNMLIDTIGRIKYEIDNLSADRVEEIIETLRFRYVGLSDALNNLFNVLASATRVDSWLDGSFNFQQITNALNDVGFEIAAILYRRFPKYFSEALEAFNNKEFARGIYLTIRDAFLLAIKMINSDGKLFESIINAILFVISPFNLPIIIAKILGLNEISTILKTVREEFIRIGTGIIAAIAAAFNFANSMPIVVRTFGDAGLNLVIFFKGFIDVAKAIVVSIADVIFAFKRLIKTLFVDSNQESINPINSILYKFTELLKTTGELLTSFARNVIRPFTHTLVELIDRFAIALQRIFRGITIFVQAAVDFILGLIRVVSTVVTNFIDTLLGRKTINAYLAEVERNTTDAVEQTITNIENNVQDLLDSFGVSFEKDISVVQFFDDLSSIAESVENDRSIAQALENLTSQFSIDDGKITLSEDFTNALNNLRSVISAQANALPEDTKPLFNEVSAVLEKMATMSTEELEETLTRGFIQIEQTGLSISDIFERLTNNYVNEINFREAANRFVKNFFTFTTFLTSGITTVIAATFRTIGRMLNVQSLQTLATFFEEGGIRNLFRGIAELIRDVSNIFNQTIIQQLLPNLLLFISSFIAAIFTQVGATLGSNALIAFAQFFETGNILKIFEGFALLITEAVQLLFIDVGATLLSAFVQGVVDFMDNGAQVLYLAILPLGFILLKALKPIILDIISLLFTELPFAIGDTIVNLIYKNVNRFTEGLSKTGQSLGNKVLSIFGLSFASRLDRQTNAALNAALNQFQNTVEATSRSISAQNVTDPLVLQMLTGNQETLLAKISKTAKTVVTNMKTALSNAYKGIAQATTQSPITKAIVAEFVSIKTTILTTYTTAILPILQKIQLTATIIFTTIATKIAAVIKAIIGFGKIFLTTFGGKLLIFFTIMTLLSTVAQNVDNLGKNILEFTNNLTKGIERVLISLLGKDLGKFVSDIINFFIRGVGVAASATLRLIAQISLFFRRIYDSVIVPLSEATARFVGSAINLAGQLSTTIAGEVVGKPIQEFSTSIEGVISNLLGKVAVGGTTIALLLKSRFAPLIKVFSKILLFFSIIQGAIAGLERTVSDNLLSGIVQFFETITTTLLRFFGLEDFANYVESQINIWKEFFSFLSRQFEKTVDTIFNKLAASLSVLFAEIEISVNTVLNREASDYANNVKLLNDLVIEQQRLAQEAVNSTMPASIVLPNLIEITAAYENLAKIDAATAHRIIRANRDEILLSLIQYYQTLQNNPAVIDRLDNLYNVSSIDIITSIVRQIDDLDRIISRANLNLENRLDLINRYVESAKNANEALSANAQSTILNTLVQLSDQDITAIKNNVEQTNIVINILNKLLRDGSTDIRVLTNLADKFNIVLNGTSFTTKEANTQVANLTNQINELNKSLTETALDNFNSKLRETVSGSQEATNAVNEFIETMQGEAQRGIVRQSLSDLNEALFSDSIDETQYRNRTRNVALVAKRQARQQRTIVREQLLDQLKNNRITIQQYEQAIKQSNEEYQKTIDEIDDLVELSQEVQLRVARGELSQERAAELAAEILRRRREERTRVRAQESNDTPPLPTFGNLGFIDEERSRRVENVQKEIENTEKDIARLEKEYQKQLERMRRSDQDFFRDMAQRQEDFHIESIRREEDYQKRLLEIQESASEDLIEAVAQRDSLAAQNALKSRDKQLQQEKEKYEIEERRRKEDFELEQQRARQQQELRRQEMAEELAERRAELAERRAQLQMLRQESNIFAQQELQQKRDAAKKALEIVGDLQNKTVSEFADMARGVVNTLQDALPHVDKNVFNMANSIINAVELVGGIAEQVVNKVRQVQAQAPAYGPATSGTPNTVTFSNALSKFTLTPLSGKITVGRAITRASGGNVSRNKLYRVGELEPELFRQGNKLYLIPAQNGRIQPPTPLGSRSSSTSYNTTNEAININLGGITIQGTNLNTQEIVSKVEQTIIPKIVDTVKRVR